MTPLRWEKQLVQTASIKDMLCRGQGDHQDEQKLVMMGMHQLYVRQRNPFGNDQINWEFLLPN
jgi:hypothetical protein